LRVTRGADRPGVSASGPKGPSSKMTAKPQTAAVSGNGH
jgi:hypothetical protein